MERTCLCLSLLAAIGAPAPCPAGPVQDVRPGTLSRGCALVEGGVFLMGSDAEDEGPVHEARVSDFCIMRTEVTQAEYAALMGANPSSFFRGRGADHPVTNVGRSDAAAYANALSERDGLKPCYDLSGGGVDCDWEADGWRLPTEAEWEYAARGGRLSKGSVYAGSDDAAAVAWFSRLGSRPVAQKAPNELGLYDMSGNVWEWVWDAYAPYAAGFREDPRGPSGKEVGGWANRGGGWSAGPEAARVSARGKDDSPGHRDADLGFRLVRRAR